jgi:hypothetical protein
MKENNFNDLKTLGYTGHVQGLNQPDFIGKSKNYFIQQMKENPQL